MRSVLAILFVVTAGFAVALMFASDPTTPLTDGEQQALATEPVPHPTGTQAAARTASNGGGYAPGISEASCNHQQRTTATVNDPGLFGQVLDHRGEGLAGLRIRLIPLAAQDDQAEWTQTDEHGHFVFANVHGTLECSLWSYLRITKVVTLAPGEHQTIALQVEEPCVLVTGTIHAGVRPVTDRTVGVHGKDHLGEVNHDEHTDQDGVYRHLLRPGSYTISVVGPPTSIAWNMKGTTIWAETATETMAQEPLELSAALPRVQRNFLLPGARVRVALQTPDNQPIGDASVTIRSDEDQAKTWSRRTDEGDGIITFEELPAGRWSIIASHEMHLTTEPRMVVTRANDGLQTVTMHMVPAGSARVKMMQGGDLREPLNAGQLELHIAGQKPIRGSRAEASMWTYNGTQFDAVPVGTHELHCEDQRLADGSIQFAPIEPIAPHAILIEAGKTTETEIWVKSRPHLMVTVDGDFESETTIEVTCAEGRVVPSRRGHDHWRAEVPAGDYMIHVRRGDLHRTEQVSVFQTEVAHTINLTP